MYVSKLKIENYRNFSNFTICLSPFTLIIGENNVGKTNLLNALGLIFSHEITFFKKRVLEIDDINFNTIQLFKQQVANNEIDPKDIKFPEVVVEVEMTDLNSDQQAVVSDWFIDTDFSTAKLTYIFSNRNPKKEDWIVKQRKEQESAFAKIRGESGKTEEDYKKLEKTFEESKTERIDFPIKDYYYTIYGGNGTAQVESYFLRMLKMEFLDALRDPKRELTASNDYNLLYRILAIRDEDKFKNLKDSLINIESEIKKNDELKHIINEIEEYLHRISLEDKDNPNKLNFQFSSIETSEILKKLSLVYGLNPINVIRNGLGRNNLLYIALILSQLSSKSFGENEVFYRLIAIEEPEAHLHSHLQKHLSANIKEEINEPNKEKQIIITSHSTHITSKLDLDNTVVIYKDIDGILRNHYIMNSFGKDAEGKKRKRFLEKYLDATNSSMFFARKIILVEGAAEEILIPEFFKLKTKRTFEQIGCSVVNVKGLAFKNFLDVVKKGYFIKCLVLTDSDSETKTENRAEDLKSEYENAIIKVEKCNLSTFEKDLINVNKAGIGKSIMLDALVNTRPINGKLLKKTIGDSDLEIETFFNEIMPKNEKGTTMGNYKADFAYYLALEIKDGFNIPKYIEDGFNFIQS